MRRSLWVTVLLAALGSEAQANDGVDSTLKSRALASAPAASTAAVAAQAPFLAARDPFPRMLMREEQESRAFRGACQHSGKDLCYDLADRRIVYRPIRQYMPKFDGLTAENVSIRHDKIVVKYSFR